MRAAPSLRSMVLRMAVLASALTGVQCSQDTSRLTQAQEARFQEEGIVRRADNVVFHYTHDYESRTYSYRRGTTRENREDRRASIVVTHRTVLIHKNERVGIEITPRSRRYDVSRREGRVLIHAGTGRTGEVWSFEPTDDAEGWTRDIRAVIRGGGSDSTGTRPTKRSARKGRSRTSPG